MSSRAVVKTSENGNAQRQLAFHADSKTTSQVRRGKG